ncbi:MAG: SLBB domain-containing protein [Acidobacteriota bacterium]|nr:MAG: SLBB domain-containing protein [Acidobacteriota bacterium]
MNGGKNSPCWISGVIICLLLAGSVSAQAPAESSKPGGGNYRIGPGDVLSIEVAGEPDLKRKVKVSEQGTIRMPYIDQDLPVAGMTEHQVAGLLREKMTVILKDPQVTLFIEEYHARMASIAGEVREPKQIALTREIRLYDLISLAGGMTDKAGNVIQLIHTRPEDSIEVIDVRELVRRPELNRVIRDGDFVNVPETGVIYVTGNVNRPGVFPMKETIKLSQAIAMAGGVAQDSKKKEIHLVRGTDAGQTITSDQVVNLLEIEKDPTKDIILKPYDVIMVPESTRSKQTRSLLQAFAGGLASALGWGVLR